MPRTVAIQRERLAIKMEEANAKEELRKWPSLSSPTTEHKLHDELTDMSHFQRDYIDIIPHEWTAVSVSLSEDRGELYVSKFQAGQSPFLLRLPLGRHNSRDADEEVFDFEQGRSELLEIIDLANYSTHDARDMTKSGAKSEWWAEREALDARLKDLLVNVENIWLGGFRGVFSQQPRRPDLLARFQKTFHDILMKHLPSRQKLNKRQRENLLTLDVRILELFVGLGDASEEGCDLDEPLMDLLYFVVDVLQFNGERNAYDEIDFDSVRSVEFHQTLIC
jgi:separase